MKLLMLALVATMAATTVMAGGNKCRPSDDPRVCKLAQKFVSILERAKERRDRQLAKVTHRSEKFCQTIEDIEDSEDSADLEALQAALAAAEADIVAINETAAADIFELEEAIFFAPCEIVASVCVHYNTCVEDNGPAGEPDCRADLVATPQWLSVPGFIEAFGVPDPALDEKAELDARIALWNSDLAAARLIRDEAQAALDAAGGGGDGDDDEEPDEEDPCAGIEDGKERRRCEKQQRRQERKERRKNRCRRNRCQRLARRDRRLARRLARIDRRLAQRTACANQICGTAAP